MNLLEKECELIGALIGDGYISLACGKYIVGFTGHPEDDVDYYQYLASLMKQVWGKSQAAKVRLRGLRMKIDSKSACLRLVDGYGLIAGENKSLKASIPDFILSDWSLLKYTIRGFADTDGSVFYSKKPGIEKYPAIELSTSSLTLAGQLRAALLAQGFRVTKLRSHKQHHSSNLCYKVCLYGRKNLEKWINEIGFSNPTKLNKALALLSHH